MAALASLAAISCGYEVKVRVPVSSPIPDQLLSNPAIASLVQKERSWGLRKESLISPDSRSRMVLTHSDWPDIYGVELQRGDSPIRIRVMSLKECDNGSGISLAVEWASDSSAVRLMGCTISYRRWGSDGGQFDLLYVLDRDDSSGRTSAIPIASSAIVPNFTNVER